MKARATAGLLGSFSYHRIPRACTQADAVVADSQAANAVLVANQGADLFASCNIPNLKKKGQRLQSAIQLVSS